MLGEHNNNNKTTTTTLSGDASNLTDAAHRSSGNLHLVGGPLLLRQSWLGGKADATDHRDRRDPLPFCPLPPPSSDPQQTLYFRLRHAEGCTGNPRSQSATYTCREKGVCTSPIPTHGKGVGKGAWSHHAVVENPGSRPLGPLASRDREAGG